MSSSIFTAFVRFEVVTCCAPPMLRPAQPFDAAEFARRVEAVITVA
jgi:hypothetical protein